MDTFTTRVKNAKTRISRASWPAIFAGTLTALAISFLLDLLGLGIGLTSFDPLTNTHPFQGLGIGTLIWWVVANLVALFIGGLVAARTSGLPSKTDGGIHGFLIWGLFLFISIFFLASVTGSILSGMGSMVSSVFGGDNAKQVVVDLKNAQKESKDGTLSSFKDVKQEIYSVLQTAQNYNIVPEGTKANVKDSINSAQTQTAQAIKKLDLKDVVSEFVNDVHVNLDKQGDLNISVEGDGNYLNESKLKTYLANNTDLSKAQINGVISKWEKKLDKAVKKAEAFYKKAKHKALKASQKVSDAIGKASIYLFIALLLGALAAFFGGVTGSPVLTVDEEHEEDLLEDEREDREDRIEKDREDRENREAREKKMREGRREERRKDELNDDDEPNL